MSSAGAKVLRKQQTVDYVLGNNQQNCLQYEILIEFSEKRNKKNLR